ncbi:DUF2147 domain-containing protein [Nonlabens sp.]|uniref:DUF2147 domain-containing protein n=1 Tax=Nonlabens sp. TaxID=1888209 RepID=UPI003F69E249
MKNFIGILLVLFAFAKAYSQDITGTWKTIDETSGIVKSHIFIYEENGKYYGKVLKVLDPDAPETPLCANCDGDFKNAPIEGLVIMKDLVKKGKTYKNGTILDPENGKVYDCKLWLDQNNSDRLKVRGYVLFLYRTQTWVRLK